MFDIQAIPGETDSPVDWAKLQHDLTEAPSRCSAPSIGDVSDAVFEMAVGELGAWRQLLLVLEQRYIELESSNRRLSASNISSMDEISRVQADISTARGEFFKAFHRLKSQHGFRVTSMWDGSQSEEQPRALSAVISLKEMEIFCDHNSSVHPGNFR